jgi:hypothetical protein
MLSSLGLVPLPAETVEHDLALLTKFQEYSAELLRLALLGITVIGYVAQQLLFGKADDVKNAAAHWPGARPWVIAALVCLSLAALASLWHRYVSSDSMSWHLQAMRRFATGDPAQVEKAKAEAAQRLRRFRWSQRGLRAAALTLGLGTACLAVALIKLI